MNIRKGNKSGDSSRVENPDSNSEGVTDQVADNSSRPNSLIFGVGDGVGQDNWNQARL